MILLTILKMRFRCTALKLRFHTAVQHTGQCQELSLAAASSSPPHFHLSHTLPDYTKANPYHESKTPLTSIPSLAPRTFGNLDPIQLAHRPTTTTRTRSYATPSAHIPTNTKPYMLETGEAPEQERLK
jgi:hypothetical protein